MGGWSTLILTFIAIYHCEANILLILNLRVTFLYMEGFSLERGGYTGVDEFSRGHHEILNMQLLVAIYHVH